MRAVESGGGGGGVSTGSAVLSQVKTYRRLAALILNSAVFVVGK